MTATRFPRAFLLHPRHGDPLPGLELPDGRAIVLDDPAGQYSTGAHSVDGLLRGGYHGARIEWADQVPAEHCGHQPPSTVSGYGLLPECVLRPGHQGSHADEHGMRWWETANPISRLRADVLREAYEIAHAEGMRLNAMEAEIGVGPYRGALGVAHLLRRAADAATGAPQPAVPPGDAVVADPHP